ncbi:anaphase-promoting complex subunit 1 [Lucilia cuprina]|uniref:anaphase-promoting complex subunit 1 n=1 Tax=Lucilia cuprina TaxID=7375 RepID=UPI001F067783|nr:anaphase-promoting complex subunit 1 [Lucilia cuprina]
MIAVSEPPLEYVPRGRPAVDEHPGPTETKPHPHLPSENILLQRLQNVNISAKEEHNEFWCIREIYEECKREEKPHKFEIKTKASMKRNSKDNDKSKDVNLNYLKEPQEYVSEYLMNSEEELYVKRHTAVWTRGLADERSILPRLCFTCETPIKFAFFCNKSFTQTSLEYHKKQQEEDEEEDKQTSICLIDQTSLRVYCSNGEDFLSNLEFPISHVWPTRFGILLEKVASNTIIQNHTISMPRLFSLSHPLDEICPVLNKSATNVISYLIESDYNIIFSDENSDLLLLYDTKIGKHFISKLRKASPDEIQYIGAQNETVLGSTVHQFSMHKGGSTLGQNAAGQCSFSQSSVKFPGVAPKNSTHLGRTSLGTSNYSTHISKFLNCAHSLSGAFGNFNRSTAASPLSNLQSTIGQHSISVQDIRKCGQSQPSKPIVPELCLEHIWTENTYGNNRDFCEISSKAFIHTDLVGQTFLCYLLPRSCKLQMVRLNNFENKDLQISTIPMTVVAKDAVALERMNMIAVLDPSGTLILYTGNVLVSKVHIPNTLTNNTPTSKVTINVTPSTHNKSPNTSFPRRSSLLPSAQKPGDTTFEDELHLLSPVHPLQPQFSNRNSNICLGLRDPAVNRLTLVYSSGKMLRISLPLINETKFVTRCIKALKQVLKKDQYIQLITKWYGARNPPGSRDYSIEQEWEIFCNVLLDLMGFSAVMHDYSSNTATSFSAEEPKKRKKNDEIHSGTEDDWQFMLAILEGSDNKTSKENNSQCTNIDTTACLFNTIPAIFYSFHLLYEDFKLDDTMHAHLLPLAKFLHQLAYDMQLESYTFHYAMDFPLLVKNCSKTCILTEQHGSQMSYKELLQVQAPSVFNQLEFIIKNKDTLPYNYVEGINDLSRNVLQVVSLVMHGTNKIKHWIKPFEFTDSVQSFFAKKPKRFISSNVSRSEQVIQMLINMKMTRKDIEHLPVAVHLIISECLEYSRLEPPIGCSPATYELILRSDLVAHAKLHNCDFATLNKSSNYLQNMNIDTEDSLSARCPPSKSGISQMEGALDDGMDNIDTKLLSLRYPDDMRITEVRRLLTSSEPVIIDITQSPGTSDHEFIEEQEKQLFTLCTRTMTLPLGRGMFTLRTSIPTPTESMPIPKLCLTGKEPIKGATVEMQQIEFPANMSLWPTFHNGVAAGLKISPNARDVDSTWIVYNKPKGQAEISTEHAGFLMALGLNNHLKTLSFMSIYEYLVKCDEMTSVGLLLGISATHRGTMNNTTTKLLSVHIEALLPATALELDIPQNIQVASLMGIGLLYQGTAKRHIAEVLLQEVGRPPGPEMENCVERESYALTAGLALGLVTLGQGESPAGLRDLQLPDTLHYYMVGGNKRLLTGSQKEKYKLPSFQVREGDQVNIDVTAPGATLALGLMFYNTDNKAVAEWMNPPNTRYLLDLVRPDLLLLRTIAHGLIMWSNVQPDEEWLHNQFPVNLRFDVEKGAQVNENEDIDHEAITQAYCNIIAGAAFCIGLKYAGTENPVAFKTLRRAIKLFLGFSGKYVGEFAGRTTIENSLMVILLAISLVFAGSGDLEILRIIRYLRSRIGTQHPHVTYGSHMAIHMSLGFLFLGAGRFTIAKTPEAVAALVCALFPKFPTHSNDNRYHLQAFRHLYVLAVEPRLFLPRDIDTRKLCLCNISVLEIGSKELRRLPMAPCMLPELNTLQKVVVDDPNYWPVSFEKDRNWNQLVKALENSACIEIKKRSGCLSHLEDPDRLKSLFSQTLTTEQSVCWEIDPKTLERFSNEPYVIGFTDRLLHLDDTETSTGELALKQHLTMLFYNAVVKDKMHVLPIYLATYNHVLHLKTQQLNFHDIWQLKLMSTYLLHYTQSHILFSKELILAYIEQFQTFIDNCRQLLYLPLRQFIGSRDFEPHIIANLSSHDVARLVAVIIFYQLTPNLMNLIVQRPVNYIGYIKEFQKLQLDASTTQCLLKVLQATSA